MAAEITGARSRLNTSATQLCEVLRSLAARLTPGAPIDLYLPSAPLVADWHDPITYHYSITGRVHHGADPYAAASLLTYDRWDVTTAVNHRPGGADTVTITGTRDGFELQVRVEAPYDGVLYFGRTPAIPLYA